MILESHQTTNNSHVGSTKDLMLLSICIPTHHGRGWCLKPAVQAILGQIIRDGLHDLVEICVSDNSSQDETAEFMTMLAHRWPKNVKYARMPFNCGIYNFLNAVRISQGEFCWLFGSDDMPAPRMLSQGVELLQRFPNSSGFSCHYETYDSRMERILPGRLTKLYPERMDVERQFDTFQDAIVQLGPSQTFMSVQCFRRPLWDKAIETASGGYVYLTPNHLHTYLISRILKIDCRWVWTPEKLIHMRSGNTAAYSLEEGPTYNHSVLVLHDVTTIWREATGADRKTFRAVLTKAYWMDWGPTAVRHNKMLANHRWREDYGMFVEFTRYLAAAPAFWWGSFPALLVPHWFWKLSNSTGILPLLKKTLLGR